MGASSPPSASAAAEGKQLTQQQEKKAAVMTPQQRASCRQLSVAFFLQCVSHNLVSYPRASLTLIFNGGDSAAAARVIALMATSGSMVEFVFGPCFGRLSDRYGRLLFLLVGPLGTVIFDGLVFLFPSQPVLILGKIVSTLTVTAFVTILRSALNDVVQGEAYAVANSSSAHAPRAGVPAHNRPMHPPPCLILVVHGSGPHFPLLWPRNSLTAVALLSMLPPLPVVAIWTGSAIVISPIIASRFVSERVAFGLSAAVSLLNGASLLTSFKETLHLSERVPVDWLQCNPLSFIKLFSHSRTMTLLVTAIFFQTLGEIRFTMDLAMVIWRSVHVSRTRRWWPMHPSAPHAFARRLFVPGWRGCVAGHNDGRCWSRRGMLRAGLRHASATSMPCVAKLLCARSQIDLTVLCPVLVTKLMW
eukprot:COSAG01_NODE_3447_length_6079_cov_12.927343_2_plen_417_part_00